MASASDVPSLPPPAAGAGGTMKQTAIALLVVTLLGGAAGGLYGFRIAGPLPQYQEKDAAGEDKPPPLASAEANSSLFELPTIVTNLGAPQDTWVRLEASLLFDPKVAPHPEALGAQIAEDILAFLRTTTLSQIQGAAGLQYLRQDLNDRVATRSSGAVKQLMIRTLVVQ
jgi:flagellar protein FliL